MKECGRNASEGVCGSNVIPEPETRRNGLLEAGQREEVWDPRARPKGTDVAGGPVSVGALLPVPSDMRIDQARVLPRERDVIETLPLECAGSVVREKDIGPAHQPADDVAPPPSCGPGHSSACLGYRG
jgi:hypothetical protein